MRVVRFDRFGGPEVLGIDDVSDPAPGAGEALVRTAAVGLNMSDVYRRQGRYALAGDPPWVLGYEAAGTVEALGPGTSRWAVGDRVAFADVPFANAEHVVAPVDRLVPVPAEISLEVAAAVLLQGLTAQFLCNDSYPAAGGERVVVHAAGGGVGLLLTQLLHGKNVQVLAVASSERKRAAALAAGAAVATGYRDWLNAARRFAGRSGGVDAVFDSIGTTLPDSVEAVRPGGTVVFYGFAGGQPAPVNPLRLLDRSVTVTGGDLWNVLTSGEIRRARALALFQLIRDDQLQVRIASRYPFSQASAAHADLESRAVIGKVLLLPDRPDPGGCPGLRGS